MTFLRSVVLAAMACSLVDYAGPFVLRPTRAHCFTTLLRCHVNADSKAIGFVGNGQHWSVACFTGNGLGARRDRGLEKILLRGFGQVGHVTKPPDRLVAAAAHATAEALEAADCCARSRETSAQRCSSVLPA